VNAKLRQLYRVFVGRSPPWTPMHLSHRALDRYVEDAAPRVIDRAGGASARILDVGCADMPYRKFFARDARCAAYDGADIAGAGAGQATVAIDPDTQRISAPSSSYDIVVSFQVLEHSSRPLDLLRECRRVLRPGGAILLTLPFIFEYHAVPRDFRRWTHEGIAEDMAATGFADIVAEPLETDLQALAVINELYLARHWGYVVTKPLFLAANMAALAATRLRRRHPTQVLPLTLGVTAVKPA
jgi:SAM-dependent methyltransferase